MQSFNPINLPLHRQILVQAKSKRSTYPYNQFPTIDNFTTTQTNNTRSMVKYICYPFFILLLITITAPSSRAQANATLVNNTTIEKYEIGGIEVVGNIWTDKELIISRSGLKVGETITLSSSDTYRAMKALWDLNLFGDVQILKQRTLDDIVFLEIIVEEKKRLHTYTLEGMKKTEEEALNTLVDDIIKQGELVSKSKRLSLQNASCR